MCGSFSCDARSASFCMRWLEGSVLATIEPDHFECDPPFEQAVLGKKHLSHGAATEFCFNHKAISAVAGELADFYGLLHGLPANERKELHARKRTAWPLASVNVSIAGVCDVRKELGNEQINPGQIFLAQCKGRADAVTRVGEPAHLPPILPLFLYE